MRMPKFRVWDNVDHMSKPFTLHELRVGLIQFDCACPIMQFTDIQDRKGNELCEGDICKVAGIGLGVVEICKYNGTQFKTLDGHDVPAIDCLAEDDDFEIVGNVHQNPELLEQNDD